MTWARDAAERVVFTFLQAWLAAWVAIEGVTPAQLFDVDILTVGLVAAVMALLKALAARTSGNPDSASLVD